VPIRGQHCVEVATCTTFDHLKEGKRSPVKCQFSFFLWHSNSANWDITPFFSSTKLISVSHHFLFLPPNSKFEVHFFFLLRVPVIRIINFLVQNVLGSKHNTSKTREFGLIPQSIRTIAGINKSVGFESRPEQI